MENNNKFNASNSENLKVNQNNKDFSVKQSDKTLNPKPENYYPPTDSNFKDNQKRVDSNAPLPTQSYNNPQNVQGGHSPLPPAQNYGSEYYPPYNGYPINGQAGFNGQYPPPMPPQGYYPPYANQNNSYGQPLNESYQSQFQVVIGGDVFQLKIKKIRKTLISSIVLSFITIVFILGLIISGANYANFVDTGGLIINSGGNGIQRAFIVFGLLTILSLVMLMILSIENTTQINQFSEIDEKFKTIRILFIIGTLIMFCQLVAAFMAFNRIKEKLQLYIKDQALSSNEFSWLQFFPKLKNDFQKLNKISGTSFWLFYSWVVFLLVFLIDMIIINDPMLILLYPKVIFLWLLVASWIISFIIGITGVLLSNNLAKENQNFSLIKILFIVGIFLPPIQMIAASIARNKFVSAKQVINFNSN